MLRLAGMVAVSIFCMPAVAHGQELDTNRLHALMSCSVVMDIASGHESTNTLDSYMLSDYSVGLEAESDLAMINASMAPEVKENAWSGYRTEATALLASDEQRFWAILDACFEDAYVLAALATHDS